MSLTPADETIWQVALARLDGKLLAAVTFRDGIGVDDLTWLAGLIAAGVTQAVLGAHPRLRF